MRAYLYIHTHTNVCKHIYVRALLQYLLRVVLGKRMEPVNTFPFFWFLVKLNVDIDEIHTESARFERNCRLCVYDCLGGGAVVTCVKDDFRCIRMRIHAYGIHVCGYA